MRTIYRPTKEAPEEKTELERKWEDEAKTKPHTLTEKVAQEEKIEITGQEAAEAIEKETAPKEDEKKKKNQRQRRRRTVPRKLKLFRKRSPWSSKLWKKAPKE